MSKVAVVTGGSRGIGRAICVRLAKEGMDIVFSYQHGKDAALETQRMCEGFGVRAFGVCANVANADACAKLVEAAMSMGDSIDVLVNNAGITRDNLTMRMSDEDFEAVCDVNLKGSFFMMREIAKVMLKQKHGSIINISSVVGILGNAGQMNYAASKAGIIGMTKSLARELAKRKIRVNAVAPGMIVTDMTDKLSDATKNAMVSTIPFGEAGTPEDVANAVAFLAGEESRYITGQVIPVDGGMAI